MAAGIRILGYRDLGEAYAFLRDQQDEAAIHASDEDADRKASADQLENEPDIDSEIDRLISEEQRTATDGEVESNLGNSAWERLHRDPDCVELPHGTPLNIIIPDVEIDVECDEAADAPAAVLGASYP